MGNYTPEEVLDVAVELENPDSLRCRAKEMLFAYAATLRCQPCDGQGNIMDMQCIGCDGTGRAAQNTPGEAVAVGWKNESRAFLAYRLNQMADGGPLAFCADTLRDAASHLHAERARVPVAFTELYKAASEGFHISETCGPDKHYWHISKFPSLGHLHNFEDAWRRAMKAAAPSQPKDAGEVES